MTTGRPDGVAVTVGTTCVAVASSRTDCCRCISAVYSLWGLQWSACDGERLSSMYACASGSKWCHCVACANQERVPDTNGHAMYPHGMTPLPSVSVCLCVQVYACACVRLGVLHSILEPDRELEDLDENRRASQVEE
jgi:hypothetical protein